MAVTLDELKAVMRMELKPFIRDLQKMNGVSGQAARKVEATWMATNRRLDGIGKSMARSLAAPMAGIGAVLGGAELIRLTDTWTDLTSRVNLAAGSMEAGADVMGRLGEMAGRTYSSLEQTAESYIANATALKELGYSTGQQLDYTEALNNALVISAAKGDRAAAIQNALSKAMAGGKLAGDELNTVIQQGGRVAEALAAGLGVGVNQLRVLGAAGKITSRDVFRSLTSQMQRLRREAEGMPATISDGIQLLRNALLQYVGQGDRAVGISAQISEALVIMADNFDKTADVALQLAGVIAGALIGRSLLKMIATLGLAGTALINFTRALSAARTMAGLSMAFTGLSAAAGPAGLLIGGALVSSLVLYSNATADATAASRTYEDALEAVRSKAKETAGAVEDAAGEIDEKSKNILTQSAEMAEVEVNGARRALLEYMATIDEVGSRRLATEDQYAQLRQLRVDLERNEKTAGEVEQAIHGLANSNPNFRKLADQITPFIVKLIEAISTADALRQRLASIHQDERITPDAGLFNRSERVGARKEENAGKDWEKEQLRRASLGKQQLALENEIARVRKEADDAGKKVTDDQIKRIAEANLAGNATRSTEGKKPKKERDDEYERLAQRIADSTAAMVAETEVQRQLNPLIEDYGYAAEKARTEQEMLNAAKKAGIEVTPKLREEISDLAEQYAVATVEAAKLAEEQDKARENAEKWMGVGKDVTKGFIDDLINGKSAAESFASAISKIGDALLNDVLNNMFKIQNMGGGGFLSGLLGMFGGGGGGINFGALSASGRYLFDTGGYTGPGGKSQPAGVVHKGEVVWSRADIARAGGVGVVEAMRRGMAGYANGGPVALRAPTMPPLAAMRSGGGGSSSATFNMSVSVSGTGDKELEARLQKATEIQMNEALRVYDREVLPARVNAVANDPYARG